MGQRLVNGMTQMTAEESYLQAVRALPLRLREEALSLPPRDRASFRSRRGRAWIA